MNAEDLERQLFELNMQACEKWRPSLFRLISDTQDSGRYHIFPSDQEPYAYNLVDTLEEKLYYELDNPVRSMASHLETCINKLQGIMVCLGFGLGYAALMLEKQRNFVSRSIVVIEPDPEILLMAFRALDCRSIIESKDVLMCVGFSVEEIGVALQGHIFQENRLINAKNVQVVDMPASLSVHGDYYLEAVKKVNSTVYEGVKFVGNCPNDALQGLDNTLANLTRHINFPGISALEGAFKGQPGVVVASGPSLDKNVHLLSEIADKAVIVSADASLRHLLKRNLKPHLISCLERLDETALLFEGLDSEQYKDVHMVASPVVHPKTFEAYHAPIIGTEREYAFFEAFNFGKGHLIPGPSAGNMAFRILKHLGCDPIILIGQDLALSEEGKTHASGDPYGDEQSVYLESPEEIEGNYTEKLQTNPVLKMFHYCYQIDVENFDGNVINATEGGARIPGTEVTTFREAIDTYVQKSIALPIEGSSGVADSISRLLKQPTEKYKEKSIVKAKKQIESAIKVLDAAEKKISSAKKAAKDFQQYVGINDSLSEVKAVKRERVLKSMNKVSGLTADPKFRKTAMDVVSAVFFHTMAEYVWATANAKTEEEQDNELIRNVENLTNNFSVLLKFVKKLYSEHLSRLESNTGFHQPRTIFDREKIDFSVMDHLTTNPEESADLSKDNVIREIGGRNYA